MNTFCSSDPMVSRAMVRLYRMFLAKLISPGEFTHTASMLSQRYKLFTSVNH